MLRHNLIFIYRSFRKYKTHFLINLTGLSAGLACALLIYLWVNDELGIDRFHEKSPRLFQVMGNSQEPGKEVRTKGSTPNPLAQALAEEIPEVEYAATVRRWSNEQGIVSFENRHFRGDEQYVGKDYFNLFSYPLIQGDKDQVLKDKYAVLLSDEMASKLFNTTENVIGKTIEWKKKELSGTYGISGIFRKPPANSSSQFDLIFNFDLYRERKPQRNEWANGGVDTYVVLKEGASTALFNEKVHDFLKKKNSGNQYWTLFARPYANGYLYDRYDNGEQVGGRIEYVRLFSIIALFILAIACINFMNLSTARASRRLREIGIKKAVGAGRNALLFQFFSESVFMAFLSLGIAILFCALLLPQFNAITGKQLGLSFNHLVPSIIIALVTGLISGSYPAIYLSDFRPAAVLKGKLDTSSPGESWVRKGLVTFQFSISVILIVLVVVVYMQLEFIQSKKLGYDKDNILLLKIEGRISNGLETFLQEMKQIPGVVSTAAMWGDMTRLGNITSDLNWDGKNPGSMVEFGEVGIGYDLIETLGIKVTDGRAFSRAFVSDSSTIMFNEAAIASMDLKDPIGKTVTLWGQERQIVGVIANYHAESLYEPLRPCFLVLSPYVNNVVVKIQGGFRKRCLSGIQHFYERYNPGIPFDFKFLEEGYQKLYVSESRVAVLARYFAGVAIVLSCLGLFGLAAFTTERRLKEIGIRKLLGSSAFGIVSLLSGDFTKIVFVSILIAWPVSFYIAKHWLDSFAFKIELEPMYFLGPGLAALLVAWVTVGMQTLKAARSNPVDILRSE